MSPTYRYPRPAVTVDVVFLAVRDGSPEVLAIRRASEPFEGRWALPGGFLDMDEDLDAAARRELLEETRVRGARLRQIGAYGRPGRDPRGRTISVAYLAVWPGAGPRAVAGDDAAAADWRPLRSLRRMAFDHARILADGRRELERLIADGEDDFLRLLPRTFRLDGVAELIGAWTGRERRVATLRRRWLAAEWITPVDGNDGGASARYRAVRKRKQTSP